MCISKPLFLAATIIAFAGTAHGQKITSCGSQSVIPSALNLRAEGTAELVGDLQFSCVNSQSPTFTGQVTAFLPAPVTSKLLTTDTPATGPQTEATLFICASTPCSSTTAGVTAYVGIISANFGNQILFTGLNFPMGTFWGRISNVRGERQRSYSFADSDDRDRADSGQRQWHIFLNISFHGRIHIQDLGRSVATGQPQRP
jgi:hypothetical protein